ncbi:S-layer homology domain-containing protein [Cohnella hongkongensis]|uniref:S-layer homology domain-containing protein n=1 Tax=Cohnella hongkongensis TaxID=178337 RepID=A0ABV9FE99_9BACL
MSIAAGYVHSLTLKSDGTVVGWGSNAFGQIDMPAGLDDVVSIAAGYAYSLALKSDGTVVGWGHPALAIVPTGLTGVVSIAAGEFHSLALKSDGTVIAWGDNYYGQTTIPTGLTGVVAIAAGSNYSLALKSDGTVITWGEYYSGQSTVPAGLDGVVEIAGGGSHSLALKSDGTVVAWGDNDFGQINVPTGLDKVVAIGAGTFHSMALKSDGTVVTWGDNIYGQTNVPVNLAAPVKGNKIAAGGYHSLALKSDGTVVAWGDNGVGQTTVSAGLDGVVSIAAGLYHSLALKSDGTVAAWGDYYFGQTNVPADLNGVVSIAAGKYHSLALKSDGTVVAWGDDFFGQTNVPADLNGVVAIAAGDDHSLALKSDGTAMAWGRNDTNQTNVPESAQSGVIAIAAGNAHSLALKSDGTVVAWGDDYSGQSTVPESAQSEVIAIAAGNAHSLALKSDGTVVAWGYNGDGQTNVPADLDWVVSIAAGKYHSLALKSDGTVVAWGDDNYGQATVPGSDNIESLALQEGPFDSPFSSADTSYTYSYIGPSVSNVHVTATLEDTVNTALSINGQLQANGSDATVSVSGASTAIPVRVEPYFKPGKTYTITVLRDSTPPDVQFDLNGNAAPSKYASTMVKVADKESGVVPASLQYAWTQSTAVPTDGWVDFTSGETLEQTSGDGNWYLHVRASDKVGNDASVVSQAFVLDNTPPTVAVSSTAGGTVNAAFPITMTFSEPVDGLDDGSIMVGNGTVSNVARTSASAYTATITPMESGQAVTVRVAANATTDAAGNGNEASDIATFLYDTTKPVVSFDFTDDQRFAAPPASVRVTVSEAVYWAADRAELNAGNALPLLSMDKDGAAFTAYTASYGEANRTYTLTFDGTLDDGVYTVNVAGNTVENGYHNTLDAASASFIVAVPVVTGISVDRTGFTSAGGSVAIDISGFNLAGQTVSVYVDGEATAAALVTSDTSASAAVTLPPNTTASDKIYILTVYVNGVEAAGRSAALTVAHAPSSNADLSGLSLSSGALSPSPFTAATTAYTASVENGIASVTVTPTVADGTATVTASVYDNAGKLAQGTLVLSSGMASPPLSLEVGSSRIAIVVTAEDGTTKTYNLTVTRAENRSYAESGGSYTPEIAKPMIDLNGISLDPDTLDITEPSVTLEVTPNQDGMAYVSIPATVLNGLTNRNDSLRIEIKAPYGSYQVPVDLTSLIPGLNDLLVANHLNAEDIDFKITLIDKSGDEAIRAAIADGMPNGERIGAIVDFHLDILNAESGQTIGASDRFSEALTRIIPMPKDMTRMPEQWGAFRYNELTKKLEFVPARAERIDAAWVVTIRSYSNSVYVVVEQEVSFADVQTHWSQSFVQLAAAKGLVAGVGHGRYAPDESVTRAEFAVMLVRAMGRGTSTSDSAAPYGDVRPGAWYFSEIAQAKELGLLDFAKGKSFMPDQPLTREEMASMLAETMKLEKLPKIRGSANLDGYRDIAEVNSAFMDDVRMMVELNVMTGTSKITFGPKGATTRAEAATVLIRMLKALEWMD